MVRHNHHRAAAGRNCARRLSVFCAAVCLGGSLVLADAALRLDVTEAGGQYSVTASFAVTEPPDEVMAVLTDYERIPKYMPDVEVSRVVERTPGGVLVEQQAVSKFMMFSRRVHLMLEVRESGGTIRFRDRCGKSFAAYAGTWTVTQHDSLTIVDYQLNARPSFEVPGFVLKRLLKRDAGLLIDRIKAEIATRADRRQ